MPSTDFGVPLIENEPISKLDDNDDSSISSISSDKNNNNSLASKERCWSHLMKIFDNSIQKFNSDLDINENKIDPDLPIILCAFSKGCIVLNQLCSELERISTETSNDLNEELELFKRRVNHLIWLDGGHSGSSNSWITNEEKVLNMRELNWCCYVYVTPYQMMSNKYWAINEYNKFISLLDQLKLCFKNKYYFKENENDDYDVNIHFEILNFFDTNLI